MDKVNSTIIPKMSGATWNYLLINGFIKRDITLFQNNLNSQISSRISRSSENRVDVMNIINICLNYPGGLEELVSTIGSFEGDSLPMRRLKAFLESVSL